MNVICIGDSNTFGYNPHARCGEPYNYPWPDLLAKKTGWKITNEGINGREVPNEPLFISDETDLYIVMLGTNDLLQLDTPEAATERMGLFLSNCDPRKVIVIAPPAMICGEWVQDNELIADSIRLSKLYEALCSQLGIRFFDAGTWNIPIAYDGVHITREGHVVFADCLYQALYEGV